MSSNDFAEQQKKIVQLKENFVDSQLIENGGQKSEKNGNVKLYLVIATIIFVVLTLSVAYLTFYPSGKTVEVSVESSKSTLFCYYLNILKIIFHCVGTENLENYLSGENWDLFEPNEAIKSIFDSNYENDLNEEWQEMDTDSKIYPDLISNDYPTDSDDEMFNDYLKLLLKKLNNKYNTENLF